MVTVNFYDFPKMPNSTAIPSGNGIVLDCQFKSPFSITNPVLILSYDAGNQILDCNLCKIDKLGRYYTISNITSLGNRWEVSLSVDVLASYRGEIENSTQYVLRAESESDGAIIDGIIPAKNPPAVTWVESIRPDSGSTYNPFSEDPYRGGCYVIGIIANTPGSIGAVTYYSFSPTYLRDFINILMGSSSWAFQGITDITENLFKALYNPMQYIVSAMWFPLSYTTAFSPTVSVTSINYGWYTIDHIHARQLRSNLTHKWTADFSIPSHPQADAIGDFLNYSPYTRHILHFPCFGTFELDPSMSRPAGGYLIEGEVDAVSGVSTMRLIGDGVALETSNIIGVPIKLAQLETNPLGIVGAVGNSVARSAIGDVAGAIGGGVVSALQAVIPSLTNMGTVGNASIFEYVPTMQYMHYPVAEDSPGLKGKPLCKNVQISTLQGYVLCDSPKLSISATAPEIDEVLRYMREGFFYE